MKKVIIGTVLLDVYKRQMMSPVKLLAKRWGIVILQRQTYILTVFQQAY